MNKYKMLYDLHTHTTFSHGKASIEENVIAGISKGLKEIAITDHGPGHINYGVKRKDLPIMKAEIKRLNEKYPDIKIHFSVEANIVHTARGLDITKEEFDMFDFVIAGYHYGVFNGHGIRNWILSHTKLFSFEREIQRRQNTEMIVNALNNNNIKILTHPGDKGPIDMCEVAKACAKSNTLMEISTWHDHLTVEEIKIAAKEDVQFIISSDAHSVGRIASFEGALSRAIEAGLDIDRIVNISVK